MVNDQPTSFYLGKSYIELTLEELCLELDTVKVCILFQPKGSKDLSNPRISVTMSLNTVDALDEIVCMKWPYLIDIFPARQ